MLSMYDIGFSKKLNLKGSQMVKITTKTSEYKVSVAELWGSKEYEVICTDNNGMIQSTLNGEEVVSCELLPTSQKGGSMHNVINLKRRSPTDKLNIAYERLSNNEQIKNDPFALNDLLLIKGAIKELENPWKPIEEAPEGVTLLVANEDGYCAVAQWWDNGWLEDNFRKPLPFKPTKFQYITQPPREGEA